MAKVVGIAFIIVGIVVVMSGFRAVKAG